MIVFKVKLIKDDQTYYITKKQKETYDSLIESGKGGIIKIGDDQIRLSSIASVQKASINDEDAPEYLIDKLKENGELEDLPKAQKILRNLPTDWIKIDKKMNIINDYRRIPQGYEGGDRYWYLAKVHYRYGEQGREYLLKNFCDLAEVLRMREDPDEAGFECISKRWVYGTERDLITGKII